MGFSWNAHSSCQINHYLNWTTSSMFCLNECNIKCICLIGFKLRLSQAQLSCFFLFVFSLSMSCVRSRFPLSFHLHRILCSSSRVCVEHALARLRRRGPSLPRSLAIAPRCWRTSAAESPPAPCCAPEEFFRARRPSAGLTGATERRANVNNRVWRGSSALVKCQCFDHICCYFTRQLKACIIPPLWWKTILPGWAWLEEWERWESHWRPLVDMSTVFITTVRRENGRSKHTRVIIGVDDSQLIYWAPKSSRNPSHTHTHSKSGRAATFAEGDVDRLRFPILTMQKWWTEPWLADCRWRWPRFHPEAQLSRSTARARTRAEDLLCNFQDQEHRRQSADYFHNSLTDLCR